MAFARRGSKDRKPKRPAQSALFKRKKFCRFTAEKVEWIDYKDVETLKDFITEQGKVMLDPALANVGGALGSTALIDGVRRFVNVRELDIDLIDRINPFEAAYAVLAKTMDAQSLRQVQDSIAGKTIKLPEDEARALALRAVQFKQERGRLPSLQAADPWEQKMAEGVAAFARYAAQAKAAQAARSAQAREA